MVFFCLHRLNKWTSEEGLYASFVHVHTKLDRHIGWDISSRSSSLRPWIDVFALPEKINMGVTESDLDPRSEKCP